MVATPAAGVIVCREEASLFRLALLALVVACGGTPPGDIEGTSQSTTSAAWSEEEWCASLASLEGLEASYDPSALRTTVVALSELRYPPAVAFIEVQSDSDLQRWFFFGTDTFSDVLDGYEVAVHEGAHLWGFESFSFDSYSYRVTDDSLIVETAYLENFARSEILARHPYAAEDFYADTYLTGFSGSQGFNTVLDEFNAYTHSLASRYCTRDTIVGATSARDGILTFKLYVELYLKTAREDHPDDYAAILDDPKHVEAILAIWDRSEHWLALSADSPELGIDDDFIASFVYDAANVDEIGRVREVAP